MAEMNITPLAATPAKKWEFNATRNKGGIHTCLLTDPDGNDVVEALHDCAATSHSRAWANPPDEISHIREYSEFIKAQKQTRPAIVAMDMRPPYGVYLDGVQIALYKTELEADLHYARLLGRDRNPAPAQ
jgi:hypothetical protein